MPTEIRNLLILWVIFAAVGLMVGMGFMQSRIIELQSNIVETAKRTHIANRPID